MAPPTPEWWPPLSIRGVPTLHPVCRPAPRDYVRRDCRQDSVGMRLSRHARNEMRLYRIGVDDVQATVLAPIARELDARGNARLTGETGDGRPILVVVAGDDPDFVIAVFLRS